MRGLSLRLLAASHDQRFPFENCHCQAAETASAVAGSLSEIVRFGLPEDYWHTYADAVRGLSEAEIQQAAVDAVRPEGLIWIVVGDRSRIEEGIRELGIGEVVVLDADGNRAIAQ